MFQRAFEAFVREDREKYDSTAAQNNSDTESESEGGQPQPQANGAEPSGAMVNTGYGGYEAYAGYGGFNTYTTSSQYLLQGEARPLDGYGRGQNWRS